MKNNTRLRSICEIILEGDTNSMVRHLVDVNQEKKDILDFAKSEYTLGQLVRIYLCLSQIKQKQVNPSPKL